ncbi:hypothetical protein Rhal01_03808 [Rubritalea halochordaticola]|uniref:HIT family protein n=1 Tax=Rubritalea halochordaticola TaxID=714537 RepID=A0ABP9V8C2_9BACT
MAFTIPEHLIVHRAKHWTINHRVDTDMPGYLMIGAANSQVERFQDISEEASLELGTLIVQATRYVEEELQPKRVFCSRYGYDDGHSVHFHVIPIYAWLEEAFLQDAEYSKLFCDGSSLTLFLWREYIEAENKRTIQGPSVQEAIARVKARFENQ